MRNFPTWIGSLLTLWPVSASSQTEGMMRALLRLGGAMTALIVAAGLVWQLAPSTRPPGLNATAFIFWALATAFTALLTGGALGLLSGLPITQKRADAANAQDSQDGSATGYVESTSLEQVADFLVKGIVALTLTSFSSWSRRFEMLSSNVTSTLTGTSTTNAAPGSLLIASYAILGFLVAYLWMRRWFIGEMVTARNEQAKLLEERISAEQNLLAQARRDNRQGVGSSTANNAASSAEVATQMAGAAVRQLQHTAAAGQAQEILKAVDQPDASDDPWKGAFGGLATRDGCTLSANVTPLLSDPRNFQIDLQLAVDDAHRVDLSGKIAHFFLHPTFGSRPRDVAIDADGRATLQIFSYGAFTVGVLVDDGTRLELDLATVAGAPQRFLER